MIDVLLGLMVLVLIGLGHIERTAHADERARLLAAALAPSPQAAVQAITPPKQAEPEREPRPTPIGL